MNTSENAAEHAAKESGTAGGQSPEPAGTSVPSKATETVRPRQRRWWVSLLLSLVLFGSGAVVGVGGTLIVTYRGVQRWLHHPEQMPPILAGRLQRRLDLSDQQTAEVEQILTQRQQHLIAIRREMLPRVETQFDLLEEEIAAVLNEEQKAQWAEMAQRFRHRWLPKGGKPSENFKKR